MFLSLNRSVLQLSGLTPFLSHHSIIIVDGYFFRLGPHVRKAWDVLRYDMNCKPIQMVVIGEFFTRLFVTLAYDNIGGPVTIDNGTALSAAEEEKISDDQIRVHPLVPCDFDRGEDWIESTDGTKYRGCQGPDILVASAALAILALATNG
jgi:hypothetical protein